MNKQNAATGIPSGLLRYYTGLREHRCRITESLRVIAFRNMDHLAMAGEQMGITKMSDPVSVIIVQNRMLEDQGLEQNPTSRWLLACATWIPWEIYMCLLYAEIENYQSISQDETQLVYPPLEVYLAANTPVVQSLKEVRDTLLHPLRQNNYDQALLQFMDSAKLTSPDFRIALVSLQNLIDDYLERVRDSLRESIVDEATAMSDAQLLEHSRTIIDHLNSLLAEAEDEKERESIRQGMKQESDFQVSLGLDMASHVPLTPFQRDQLSRWQQRFGVVTQHLPERPYKLSRANIQTPIHKELSSFLPDPTNKGQPGWTGLALPEFVQRRRAECLGLIFRSLIMFNEPYTAIIADFDDQFPGRSRTEVFGSDERVKEFARRAMPLETVEDYRQAELRIGPSIVSQALLAEPLRLYQQAISGRDDLKREEIDQRIAGDSLATFSKFRNVVFHVPDGRTEMVKAESDLFQNASLLNDYREVIYGLFRFYLPDRTDT